MKTVSDKHKDDIGMVSGKIPHLEKIYNKTLLITGATGLICSSVVEIVQHVNKTKGANVRLILAGRNKDRIINRFEGTLEQSDFEFMQYDSTSAKVEPFQADYVIHGAGTCSPAFYVSNPVETIKNNIVGVQALLEVTKENKESRLLYISSSEVYGNRNNGSDLPYKEHEYGYLDILNPRACYPSSKRASETLCKCYAEEYGADVVIARPGHIYGPYFMPGDSKASTVFTEEAVSGKNIVMKSAGAQVRSYCYALDCASAIISVLLNGECGEAYNIANSKSKASIRQFAETLAEICNVEVRYEDPSFEDTKSFNMMVMSALDSTKLESLGWEGCFDLMTGLQRTCEILKGIGSYKKV